MRMLGLWLGMFFVAGCLGSSEPIHPDVRPDGGEGAASSGGQGAGGASGCACDAINGTRLKAVVNTGTDGTISRTLTWFDTATNDYCMIVPVPGGTSRCVPQRGNATVVATYFSDAACSVVLGTVTTTPGCPSPPVPAFATETRAESCGVAVHVYKITGAWPGPVYANVGGCKMLSPGSIQNTLFYSLGTEIDYDSFVSFAENHE